MRAEQTPASVLLNAFHEQVAYPQGIEQVAGTQLFFTVVFAQVEKPFDIGMPGFKVNGKGAFAFAATLVNITGRIVKYAQHGNNTVAGAIGAADIATGSAHIMN